MFTNGNSIVQMVRLNNSKKELYENKGMSLRNKTFAETILDLQNRLSQKMIKPIEPLIFTPYSEITVPEDFYNAALFLIKDNNLDLVGAYIALVGAISCALWGRVVVQVCEDWYEPVINYVIQYAESGMRKTAFMNKLIKPILDFENTLTQNQDTYLSSLKKEYFNSLERGIIQKSIYKQLNNQEFNLKKSIDEWKFISDQVKTIKNIKNTNCMREVHLVCRGGTLKGIERMMQFQGGTQALLSSDANFLVELFDVPNDLLLQAHTQERYNREKYPRGVEIAHPALPMVLLTQPEIAKKLYMKEKIMNNGLLNRVTPYFNTSKKFKFTKDVDIPAYSLFENKIKSLISRFFTQEDDENWLRLQLDDNARAVLYEFERNISYNCDKFESGKGWLSKLHGQAVRFAACIHCWNNSTNPGASSISGVEMIQGIYLAECAIPHALFAFSPYGLSAMYDAKKILSSIYHIKDFHVQDDLLVHGTTSSTISRRIGISHARVKAGLNYLENLNYLIAFDDGSPYVRVALHPQIFNDKF